MTILQSKKGKALFLIVKQQELSSKYIIKGHKDVYNTEKIAIKKAREILHELEKTSQLN